MANLGLIDFKIGLHIKGNVNVGQNKFEVHRNDFLHEWLLGEKKFEDYAREMAFRIEILQC